MIYMAKKISTGFITDKINGIKVNSSLKCNADNYNNCASRDIEYIVMHYTGNKKDTAKANANYFTSPNRSASAHFFVDNSNIYQSVELRDAAWHCGTSKAYYHDDCRNGNSIGIEMCCTAGNYKISTKTQQNAAFLCAHLCKMIGITAAQVDTYVLRHYDITHKSCPAQMVSNTSEWTTFKTYVKNILNTGNIAGTVKQTKKPNKKDKNILDWQKAAKKDGFTITADGIWGPECESVAKKAICKDYGVNWKYKNLTKIVQKAVGVGADGKFGSGTKKAVIKYQQKNRLTADGVVGLNTWKKILGVK
jgi:N-acetylmuramoyl-L-alanine amidase